MQKFAGDGCERIAVMQRRAVNRAWDTDRSEAYAVPAADAADDDDDQIDRELIALLRRNLAAGPEFRPNGARRSLNNDLARLHAEPAPKKRLAARKKKAGPPPEVPPDAGGLDKPPEGFKPPSRELPIRPVEKKPAAKGQKPAQTAPAVIRKKPDVPRTSHRSKSAPGERGRKEEGKGKAEKPQATTDGETDAEDAAAKAAKRAEVRLRRP